MKRQFLLFGLLIILFSACQKDTFNASKQATIDDDKIKAYIAANHINVTKDPSGIYYQIITADTGAHPTVSDTVQVTYTGKLLNGTVFDSEVASNFPLSTVIRGWQIALPLIGAKSTAGGAIFKDKIYCAFSAWLWKCCANRHTGKFHIGFYD